MQITFDADTHRQMEFVGRNLHLTKQQFIRQAVHEKLASMNLFEMAGGSVAEVPSSDHHNDRERRSVERELAPPQI